MTDHKMTNAQQSLTGLWLIEQINQYTANDKGMVSVILRDPQFPVVDKIQFLKDQATDEHSRLSVINLIGPELTQKVLNYNL